MVLFKKIYKKIGKTTILKEVEKIKNDPNTGFVEYNKTYISIVTRDIRNFGKFSIIIRLRGSDPEDNIKISNLLIEKGRSQHYHVGEDGHPCLGNLYSDVRKGLKYKRYYLVYNYMIELLNNFNRGDSYMSTALVYKNRIEHSKKIIKVVKIKKKIIKAVKTKKK